MFFTIAILLVAVSFANAQSGQMQRTIGIRRILSSSSGGINSVPGLKSAVWDEYPHVLTLQYNLFKKDEADNVQKAIASAGNDTKIYSADAAVYQKLLNCCHYQRKRS